MFMIMIHNLITLPDDIINHITSFLITNELSNIKNVNSHTYNYTKSLVFIRKVHSIIREKSFFFFFVLMCWDEKECRILTQIKNKLINDIGANPYFVDTMDPNSLIDFNRSIEWLDIFDQDQEFIHLLYDNDSLWSSNEKVYIEIWKNEFRMWHNQ